MKVFLSWSGNRSKAVAEALREWLPMVLQSVEPWLSEKDVAAGERWSQEVNKELDASPFGIICLTRDNLNAPWLLFESGALSKKLESAGVCPYILDLELSNIAGPLAQFQAKKAEKGPTLELLQAINTKLSKPLDISRLHSLFEVLWPTLERRLREIPADTSTGRKERPIQEVLEELVAAVRGLEHRFSQLDVKIASLRPAKNSYVKVVVKSDVGRLRQGRTIKVAATTENFVESIARIAEINPLEYMREWCLWDEVRGNQIGMKDCQDILAYFDGVEPVVELSDDVIPF